jgi:hypothetical protein
MPTDKEFRRIALALEGAIQSAHMGHPDFRVGGRIFATLHQDLQHAMVKLTPEQQERFVAEHGDAFAPENGAWGRQGSTRVRLAAVDEDALGQVVTLAWQNTVRKQAAPRSKSVQSPKAKRRPR